MKKNKSTIIITLVITLAFGAGLGWRWTQGTPYYALYQIGAGLKNRDLDRVLTYVDLESVLSQQLSGPLSNILSSLTAAGPLGKITGPLGGIKIQLTPEMNKGLGDLVIRNLREYLENKKNPTLSSSFLLLTLAHFKVKQDFALVTLKHAQDQLRMGLKKQAGIWRVVELNPEDTQRLIKTYLLPPSK
jgi:hypothetical protein